MFASDFFGVLGTRNNSAVKVRCRLGSSFAVSRCKCGRYMRCPSARFVCDKVILC